MDPWDEALGILLDLAEEEAERERHTCPVCRVYPKRADSASCGDLRCHVEVHQL